MYNLYKKYEEIINYLIFGVLTTLVSIVSYFAFSKIFNINYLISNVIAFIISVLFAFVTNKLYVFKSKDKNVIKELIGFVSSRLFSFGIEMLIMYIFVSILKIDDMITKLINQVIVIILNYVLSKLYVFKKKGVNK